MGCALCGRDGGEIGVGLNGFALRRCRACDLFFVSPRPTPAEIGRWYPDSYGAHREMGEAQVERALTRKTTRMAPFEGVPPGRILDVGCGSGYDLLRLAKMGWRTSGIEVDPAAAAQARALGHELFEGMAEHADFPDASFDAITMMHSLEHVHDPIAVLSNMRRMLAPGGRILVTIPHIDSTSFRIFRSRWSHLEVPRHLYFYTRRSLGPVARRAGLRVVRYTFHSGTRGFRYSLEGTAWRPLLGPIRRKGPFKFIFRTACRFVGDALRAGDIVQAELRETAVSAIAPTPLPTT